VDEEWSNELLLLLLLLLLLRARRKRDRFVGESPDGNRIAKVAPSRL